MLATAPGSTAVPVTKAIEAMKEMNMAKRERGEFIGEDWQLIYELQRKPGEYFRNKLLISKVPPAGFEPAHTV